MDLDTGSYVADISTYWLGDNSDWVIKASSDGGGDYIDRFRISERVDRWQSLMGKELPTTNSASNTAVFATFTGSFNATTIEGSK
jgi:hypothetical protein